MKRRKFTDAFKRRVLAEIDAAPHVSPVLDKHRLSWDTYNRFKATSKANGHASEASKPVPAKQVPLEALVLLRQAKRAWEAGHNDRAKYTALLALTSLEEK